jgi:amidase
MVQRTNPDISIASDSPLNRRTLVAAGGAAVVGLGAAGLLDNGSNSRQPSDGTGGGAPTAPPATQTPATPPSPTEAPATSSSTPDDTLGFVDQDEQAAKTEETAPESTPAAASADPVDPATVIEEITIRQLREHLDGGAFTIAELVQASLDRIAELDDPDGDVGINAIITVNPDALAIAAELDAELQAGQLRGMLHGIPVLLKDIVATGDQMPNTAGSIAMQENVANRDAFVAARLREAGAAILGKTNLTEWSNFMGSSGLSGWSSLGGLTRNPYNLNMSCSGSSSGSAAAVAASYVPLAVGAEFDGSIIAPSAHCGIVGVKPTVGLTSRSGVIPIGFTRDSIGPLARTVEDAAIALGVMAGLDPEDPSRTVGIKTAPHAMFDEEMVPEPGTADYTAALDPDALNGARIGIFLAALNLDEGSQALFDAILPMLEEAGAELVDVDGFPGANDVTSTYLNSLTEFSWGLQGYLDMYTPDGPMQTIQDIVDYNLEHEAEALQVTDQSGLTDALAARPIDDPDYLAVTANNTTAMRANGIDAVMNDLELDAIVAPTTSMPVDVWSHQGFASSSSVSSLAGYPSITLPIGVWNDLPGGIHFFGRAFSEATLLGLAYALEQRLPARAVPTYIPIEG